MGNEHQNIDIIYGIEDKPEFRKALPLAFQHVFAMFAANITVPLMVSSLIGLSSEETTFLIQCALFMAGVGTLIQIRKNKRIGSGLPIVMGTSNAFLSTVLSIASSFGLGAVFTASFLGGLFEIFLGKNIHRLRKIFSPIVSGVVVVTLGITLIPVGLRQAAGGVGNLGDGNAILVSSVVLLTIILCNKTRNRFMKSASILIGILAGFILSGFLGMVSMETVGSSSWIEIPMPFRYKWDFQPAAVIGMLFMYVATTIETIGDISALTVAGESREPTENEKTGGVMADGISSALAAMMNGFPNTSYTQNIGVVNLTGVFSRHVVRIGAYLLLLLAFFPKFATVLSIMPGPVLGGASIAMFSMVAVSGISLLGKITMNSRNSLIVALSLGLGIGLSIVPEALSGLHKDLQLILTSGVVPSAVTAMVLDHWLPREERS
ncbi:purine permease [Proteiniclasticum sp. SCR006]|uniref:Purine permease n=1 Tax=Proteiniclasticum aestuarii TaxID=2817862 RepID=A0A939H4I9_9CLOT|nr:nucleobase:cation symporter-2 family protein [Proteiniclasticum aestuarii]MBO1264024.1 purine permease [Proteiniclasticum aestuarii]